MPPASESISWKPVVKAGILAAVILAALLLMKSLHLDVYFNDPDWRRQMQKSMGGWLPAIYFAAGTVLIAAGFLRTAYTILGGALFGFVWGAVWGHAATMAGSALCFWLARSLGREWVNLKFGGKFDRLKQRLRTNGFGIMLLIRLCPIGNNFTTNCLAGASPLRTSAFLSASFLGHLPLTIFCALLGSGLVKGQPHQTGIGLAGFAMTTLIFVIYFRRSKAARQVARDLHGGANGPEGNARGKDTERNPANS